MSDDEDAPAPPGTIWVCPHCGKTAAVRWKFTAGSFWDESCMVNAILCHQEKVNGIWQAVRGAGRA